MAYKAGNSLLFHSTQKTQQEFDKDFWLFVTGHMSASLHNGFLGIGNSVAHFISGAEHFRISRVTQQQPVLDNLLISKAEELQMDQVD